MPRPPDRRSGARPRRRRSRSARHRRLLYLHREAPARDRRIRHRDVPVHASLGPQGDRRPAISRFHMIQNTCRTMETTMKKLMLKVIALSVATLFGAMLLTAASPALAQQKKVAIANMGPHGSLEQV